ncbi:cytochrome P450 [Aspergillus flavus]|uniref:Cytochrome P450 n=1 Tax=Aspergillus flavus TaxID=5059 RepID=A0AB74CBS0_ASPFL|nr:cytochrome P450 [Aspergillus flavus]RAQ76295.1 cytochrome P450 [Aspergillus flavus]RMZ42842.1 cytochrome P450 [Aspergillus flavus]
MYRKDPEFYARFGFPGALGAETNPLIHQRQRKELEPFFSSKGVEACYPKIWAKVDIMCQGLQQRQAAGESVELVYLFKRLTLDVIYLLAFEIDLLNTDRYGSEAAILSDVTIALGAMMFFKWVPGLSRLVFSLPLCVIRTFFGSYVKMCRHSHQLVQRNYSRTLKESGKDRCLDSTIFDSVLRSFAKTQDGSNLTRVQTGKVVDDVALSTTLVYLCKCPKEMVKLRHEVECLRETNVQDIQLATISQIPYLDAVIREANRLSSPLSTVLPREVPSTGYVIGGHFLPKGTIVGFHLDDINRNPKFFPEPNEFIPERWSGEEGKKLQRWFVPFSKCSRRCIGMDFALVEMKLVVAAIISRFEIWLDNPNVSLNSREMLVKIPGDDLRIRLREITF